MARAIKAEPATVRRLFSSDRANPTLGTLAEVGAALGLRIALEPIAEEDQRYVTRPLLEDRVANTSKLARHLEKVRASRSLA